MATQLVGKIEGLEEDVKMLKSRLEFDIAASMASMVNFVENELQQSIQKDVYDAYSRHGDAYIRRSEEHIPGDDYSMIDLDETHGNITVDISADGFKIDYHPQGYTYQENPEDWSLYGDRMIRRIETAIDPRTGEYGYTWTPPQPLSRPFLTPLVQRLIEGGGYDKELVRLINLIDGEEMKVVKGGKTEREAEDWDG